MSATQSGELDRLITFEARTDAQDELGQPVPSWTDAVTVAAKWIPLNSREAASAGQWQPTISGVLRIRYRGDVRSTWRVRFGDTVLELAGPPIEIGRRQFMDLPVRALSLQAVGRASGYSSEFSTEFF